MSKIITVASKKGGTQTDLHFRCVPVQLKDEFRV
jgi:hypothetical protein